jgi:acyl-CoA thioesterase I
VLCRGRLSRFAGATIGAIVGCRFRGNADRTRQLVALETQPGEVMRKFLIALALLAPTFASWNALADSVTIVALGASNTYGKGRGAHPGGVAQSQAYPAQLQALLKEKGIDARVINAGVPGDTTGGMLARLNSAVPSGTRIVILQTGGNDARRGLSGEASGNTAQITSKLRERGIRVILLDRIGTYAPASTRDPDGQHFNAQGHAAIAARLLPQVMAAIGR